jgi:hypothetical protein
MSIFALLLLAAQDAPQAPKAEPYRPAAATLLVEPVAMMLAGFDSDGDGRITQAEMTAGVARSFAAIANGAPSLSYIGYGDWAERWLGDSNAVPSSFEIDRNGDGQVTLDELQERIGAIFDRLDGDKDHVLTHKELITLRGSAVGGDRAFGEAGERGRGRRGR